MKCRGENHGMAKLTEREAKAILRLRHAGVGYHLLAEAFQISSRTVGSICRSVEGEIQTAFAEGVMRTMVRLAEKGLLLEG